MQLSLHHHLVHQYLAHCPYFNPVVLRGSQQQLGLGPVADRDDLVLVLYGFGVRPEAGVGLYRAHLKQPSLQHCHHVLTETVYLSHYISTEYGVETVGPTLLKNHHSQIPLSTSRHQPLLLTLPDLLDVGHLLSVVAYSGIHHLRLMHRQE